MIEIAIQHSCAAALRSLDMGMATECDDAMLAALVVYYAYER
jgi:hypothetical protein